MAPMLSKNEMLQRRERSVADREKALELAQGRQLSAKAQLEKESHQALWSVESQQRNALLEMKNEFASDAAVSPLVGSLIEGVFPHVLGTDF